MEKKAEHKSTTVKQVWLCGIEFTIVGTSGTFGARGIIHELIALKSYIKCQLVPSAFLMGLIGAL